MCLITSFLWITWDVRDFSSKSGEVTLIIVGLSHLSRVGQSHLKDWCDYAIKYSVTTETNLVGYCHQFL